MAQYNRTVMKRAAMTEYKANQSRGDFAINDLSRPGVGVQGDLTLNGDQGSDAFARQCLGGVGELVCNRVIFGSKIAKHVIAAEQRQATAQFGLEDYDQTNQDGCEQIV